MSRRTKRREPNHYYGMLAYLLVGVIGIAISIINFQSSSSVVAATTLSLVLFVLAIGGIATYPLLFKDSMYLSRANHRWRPSWWKYVGLGLGGPFLLFFVGNQLGTGQQAFGLALFSYLLGTVSINAVYLYRRHKYIGRP